MDRICFGLQLIALIVLIKFTSVQGHGRLMEPVARGTRWRFNSSAPHDYNDNQGWCGGLGTQWNRNNGRCGLCGDSFSDPAPRQHELGGKYGEGVIVKRYKAGSNIEVLVHLTANHRGYFQFDVCNLASGGESEGCFARNPLQLTDGGDKFQLPDMTPAKYKIGLRIPPYLVCRHCVLRWTYTTANNWGYCQDGSGRLGCGPQENFKGCSDIVID